MLQDDKNNYICSIYLKEGKAGVCFADVSRHRTLHRAVQRKLSTQIITELCRYSPSEVLFNAALLDLKDVTAYIKQHMTCAVELLEDEQFAPQRVEQRLTAQFGADWAAATGFVRDGCAPYAMSGLLGYLHATQKKKGVERLKSVHNYAEAQYMQLSPVTRANLELTGDHARPRKARHPALGVG